MKFIIERIVGADWSLVRARNRALAQSETSVAVAADITDAIPGQQVILSTLQIWDAVQKKTDLDALAEGFGPADLNKVFYVTENETFYQYNSSGALVLYTPTAPAIPTGDGGGDGGDGDPEPMPYKGVRVIVVRNDSLPANAPNVYDSGYTGAGDFTKDSDTRYHKNDFPTEGAELTVILHDNTGTENARYCIVNLAYQGFTDATADPGYRDGNGYVLVIVFVNADNTSFLSFLANAPQEANGGTIGQF